MIHFVGPNMLQLSVGYLDPTQRSFLLFLLSALRRKQIGEQFPKRTHRAFVYYTSTKMNDFLRKIEILRPEVVHIVNKDGMPFAQFKGAPEALTDIVVHTYVELFFYKNNRQPISVDRLVARLIGGPTVSRLDSCPPVLRIRFAQH